MNESKIKTELGKKLLACRNKALAKGMPVLSVDEINKKVAALKSLNGCVSLGSKPVKVDIEIDYDIS